MTYADYSRTDDELAVLMHAETEAHIKRLRITTGKSRKAVLEHLVCFAENDEEAPAFTTAPGKPRKPRQRRAQQEVRA